MGFLKSVLKKVNSTSLAIQPRRFNRSLSENFHIPEPTLSLLWVTDEDVSKIEHAGSITIQITLTENGADVKQRENGFYAEPSLIWSKLAIKPNANLETRAMYYPSYSTFSPEIRFQYLNWLRDITKPTNLSYVFLYFYGLERHLLVGDYDKAVDEIIRLVKYHDQKSFRAYASTSVIVASLARKRLDIIDRMPSLLEEEVDEALALRIYKGTSMSPGDIIDIATRVGFTNKRYIKLHPDIFGEELQKQIDSFEKQYGKLLSVFRLEDFEREEATVFANMSIPEKLRHVKVPVILRDEKFVKAMYTLLERTHSAVKVTIANKSRNKSK